jgi:hypothetical protein
VIASATTERSCAAAGAGERERYHKKEIFHAAPQSVRTLSVQFALRCVGSFAAPGGAHRFDQNATKSPFWPLVRQVIAACACTIDRQVISSAFSRV